MLRRVDLVRTGVSEAPSSSESSVLTKVARRNIPENAILHRHHRENLKSYTLNLVYIWIAISRETCCKSEKQGYLEMEGCPIALIGYLVRRVACEINKWTKRQYEHESIMMRTGMA
jgi:hypothetical protein